jgi:hypothetical protein
VDVFPVSYDAGSSDQTAVTSETARQHLLGPVHVRPMRATIRIPALPARFVGYDDSLS